jgi:serine/threonine protein kinase
VGPAADVYALGAVVVFAATGLAPSQGGKVEKLTASLQDVIEGCLEIDPDDRPTPQEIRGRLSSDTALTPSKTMALPDTATASKPGTIDMTVGFNNPAEVLTRVYAAASYSLMSPPRIFVRVIHWAGNGMTVGSSNGARRFSPWLWCERPAL